ncbi:MAG: hypothetical protein ACREC2_15090 [Bradyrhizobium sp.]
MNATGTGSTGRAATVSNEVTPSASDAAVARGGKRLQQPAMVTASAPMISVLMQSSVEA